MNVSNLTDYLPKPNSIAKLVSAQQALPQQASLQPGTVPDSGSSSSNALVVLISK